MYPFRKKTPKRRAEAKERTNYSSHKKDLREDFNNRCGYCDDADFFKLRSFAIDHFVPKTPKDFTHDIEPNYYYNLVWACNFCNGAKSNKWITKNAAVHNDGEQGFIEPTSEEYTNLFKRDKDGSIKCNGVNASLSRYIIEELKLWYPIHRITWKLEKINQLEKNVSAEMQRLEDSPFKNELEVMQNEIRGILIELFRILFAENE